MYTTQLEKPKTLTGHSCHFCGDLIKGGPVYRFGRAFCNDMCDELEEERNQSADYLNSED